VHLSASDGIAPFTGPVDVVSAVNANLDREADADVLEPYLRSFFRRLYIQGVSNSGDSMMSRRYMRLQMLLPLLLHPGDTRSVLVIGLGTGITCGTSLAWPSLERRV
jgi:spermidine synthase